MRFEAALNAEKALEDKRYAETVANIAAAKREAAAKVAAATSEFKVQLLELSSTVKQQVSKVNNRIDDTAGVVRSDAAAQAKINSNDNAETDDKLDKLALEFNTALAEVRKTLADD